MRVIFTMDRCDPAELGVLHTSAERLDERSATRSFLCAVVTALADDRGIVVLASDAGGRFPMADGHELEDRGRVD